VKTAEEIMEILEAYDLTGSYRAAAALVSCSHHTVEQWVSRREKGCWCREHRCSAAA
jgi:transposase